MEFLTVFLRNNTLYLRREFKRAYKSEKYSKFNNTLETIRTTLYSLLTYHFSFVTDFYYVVQDSLNYLSLLLTSTEIKSLHHTQFFPYITAVPQKARKEHGFPRLGIKDGYEPPNVNAEN